MDSSSAQHTQKIKKQNSQADLEEQKGQEVVSNTGLRRLNTHTPFSASGSAAMEIVLWTPNLRQLCVRGALKVLVWPWPNYG